jgi:hypothetical protein
MATYAMGDVFDVAGDIASGAAGIVTGAAGDVIDTVPGGRDVADAVDSVVTGPIRDFANTAVGRTVLTALASTVTGGLAPVLGPQLATVAFALPGLAAGNDFITSWMQAFGERVNQLADAYAQQAGPLINAELSKASAYLDQLNSAGIDAASVAFQDFAKASGVSDWTAAFVLDAYRGVKQDLLHVFNFLTGSLQDVSGISLTSGAARQSLQNLQNQLRISNAAVGTSAGSAVHSYALSAPPPPPPRAATPVASAVRGTAPAVAPSSNTTIEIAVALGALVLLGGAAVYYSRRK